MAIGDFIIDLQQANAFGVFTGIDLEDTLNHSVLNDFIALGKATTTKVRLLLQQELCTEGVLKANAEKILVKQSDAHMHLPLHVGDYTDFYSSREHATNVGALFRDPENGRRSHLSQTECVNLGLDGESG